MTGMDCHPERSEGSRDGLGFAAISTTLGMILHESDFGSRFWPGADRSGHL